MRKKSTRVGAVRLKITHLLIVSRTDPADPLPIASSYDEPEAEISASGLFEGL